MTMYNVPALGLTVDVQNGYSIGNECELDCISLFSQPETKDRAHNTRHERRLQRKHGDKSNDERTGCKPWNSVPIAFFGLG